MFRHGGGPTARVIVSPLQHPRFSRDYERADDLGAAAELAEMVRLLGVPVRLNRGPSLEWTRTTVLVPGPPGPRLVSILGTSTRVRVVSAIQLRRDQWLCVL